MLNTLVVIDKMEEKVYYFCDEIEMGFSLDWILEERNRLEIPYSIVSYNFGRVMAIK